MFLSLLLHHRLSVTTRCGGNFDVGSGLVTFDSGDDGWNGPTGIGGITFIDNTFGNPAPALRTT